MTGSIQGAELHSHIWKVANDVHGSVVEWDIKQLVLGTLIYRFVSEHFTTHIEGDDDTTDNMSPQNEVKEIEG